MQYSAQLVLCTISVVRLCFGRSEKLNTCNLHPCLLISQERVADAKSKTIHQLPNRTSLTIIHCCKTKPLSSLDLIQILSNKQDAHSQKRKEVRYTWVDGQVKLFR